MSVIQSTPRLCVWFRKRRKKRAAGERWQASDGSAPEGPTAGKLECNRRGDFWIREKANRRALRAAMRCRPRNDEAADGSTPSSRRAMRPAARRRQGSTWRLFRDRGSDPRHPAFDELWCDLRHQGTNRATGKKSRPGPPGQIALRPLCRLVLCRFPASLRLGAWHVQIHRGMPRMLRR